MEESYKSLHIISTAEQDNETKLFRTRIVFETSHAHKNTQTLEAITSVVKATWIGEEEVPVSNENPPRGRFKTKEEAERYGIERARKLIDEQTKK